MELKKILPPEELNQLMENREDIDTRNTIIEHNLKLVKWVINKYFRGYYNIEYEDLFQCGVLGLMAAIDKYDSNKGKFSNYAIWYVRSYIQRQMFIFSNDISLEATLPGNEDLTYSDTIPNSDRPFEETVEETVLAREVRQELKKELTDIEYTVLDIYYGFEGKEPKTMEKTGEVLNLTKAKATSIKEKSFRKLRYIPNIRRFKDELYKEVNLYRGNSFHGTIHGINNVSSVERAAMFRQEIIQRSNREVRLQYTSTSSI